TGPASGMARVAITRIENPPGGRRIVRELCNVKLDGSYLVYVEEYLVKTQDLFTTLIDIPAGSHTIQLEHAAVGAQLGSPPGELAISVSGKFAGGSYNEIVVYGDIGAERSKVFLDEHAGVPAGSYRARVMNLLDFPQDLSVLACPTIDSCTTIKSDLKWGEVWEDVVDVGILAAAIQAGSAQPVPLPVYGRPGPPRVVLPHSTPAFVTAYSYHAWPYDSPDPCPACLGV